MPHNSWTVRDAKAQLSEVLRRARAGEPRHIGMTGEACIIISAKTWEALHPTALGAWLVDNAPTGEEIQAPRRSSYRSDPFASTDSATS